MRGVQAKRLRRKARELVSKQIRNKQRISAAALHDVYRRVYRGLKRQFKEA